MTICAASQFILVVLQRKNINWNLAHPSFFHSCAAVGFILSRYDGCAILWFFDATFVLQWNLFIIYLFEARNTRASCGLAYFSVIGRILSKWLRNGFILRVAANPTKGNINFKQFNNLPNHKLNYHRDARLQ